MVVKTAGNRDHEALEMPCLLNTTKKVQIICQDFLLNTSAEHWIPGRNIIFSNELNMPKNRSLPNLSQFHGTNDYKYVVQG